MTTSEDPSGERELSLRFAGTCTVCGAEMPKGTRALHNAASKSVRHLDCAPSLDRGSAGASARREYDRRTARDAARIEQQKQDIRDAYGSGFIGKVATFLAVDDSPRRSTEVWKQGAVGEERVAAALDALAEVGVVALHDRRIPRTTANIDHLAITPWGVWVVDAKRYLRGRPDVVIEGGFLGVGGTQRLTVGGRKQDKLVTGVLGQVDRVAAVVGEAAEVRGMLCFVDADWPIFGGHFSVRGVRVVWPNRMPKELLRAEEPTVDVEAVSRKLAAAFPPA